ncbi:MAG: YdeI/OmpD-associated family protein [Bacteroidota bacterium]
MELKNGVPAITASSRAKWRSWLADNYSKESKVWLIIFHKDSGKPSVYYDEAVDEALCYGWIDSSIRKRDEESYYQYFSKRKPKSNWSKVNKAKIKKLLAQGIMAEPGLEMVRIAKETGTWTALDDVENLVIPTDLQTTFEQYDQAFNNFDAFPRSVKRGILEWIFNAKRPETRAKRVNETATLAQDNIRANQYRQPKKK